MDPHGDITDLFDEDDDLLQSIDAGREGSWSGDHTSFEDATPSVERNKSSATAAAQAQANDELDALTATGPEKQQATVTKPRPAPRLPPKRAAKQGVPVTYAASLFAAAIVFTVATIAHGLFDGWRVDLVYRAAIALSLTGVIWQRCQLGRLRAMAVAAATYLALFAPSENFGQPDTMFALFLGMLIVVVGGGLIGVQRTELAARDL